MSRSKVDPSPATETFLLRLRGFFSTLRAEGLAVGTGAQLDLGNGLELLTILDRNAFHEACRSTLAKSPGDLEKLDRVFRAYFSRSSVSPGAAVRPPPRPPRVPPTSGRPIIRLQTAHPHVRTELVSERRSGLFSPQAPTGGHDLELLSPQQFRRLRAGARRFRRSVATLPGRAWWRSTVGDVDLPATARRSVRSGGELVELLHRARRNRRAELVILWDVSGSMREHEGSLLALVYLLKRAVPRARVFAFGTGLTEITATLEGQPYARVRDQLFPLLDASGGGTQIGRCLTVLRRSFGNIVRPRTTLVVLSDAWDLGDTQQLVHEFARVARCAHRTVWVDPHVDSANFEPATAALHALLPEIDLLTGLKEFPRPWPVALLGTVERRSASNRLYYRSDLYLAHSAG